MAASMQQAQVFLLVNEASERFLACAGAPRSLQSGHRTHSALDVWPDRALPCRREGPSTGLTHCCTLVCSCHTLCLNAAFSGTHLAWQAQGAHASSIVFLREHFLAECDGLQT